MGLSAKQGPAAGRPDVPHRLVSIACAAALTAAYVAMVVPALDSVFFDYDEGYYIVDARHVARGQRPFVDFAYHQTPLHLYLLAASGKLFGETLFGMRMLSLAGMAASGLALFFLARPFVGSVAALVAQAVFLFSQSQIYALAAVPEPAMLAFTLLGAVALFLGRGRATAHLAGVAFVVAILIKPTCIVVVLAAAASLAAARDGRRLLHLAAAGAAASAARSRGWCG